MYVHHSVIVVLQFEREFDVVTVVPLGGRSRYEWSANGLDEMYRLVTAL